MQYYKMTFQQLTSPEVRIQRIFQFGCDTKSPAYCVNAKECTLCLTFPMKSFKLELRKNLNKSQDVVWLSLEIVCRQSGDTS